MRPSKATPQYRRLRSYEDKDVDVFEPPELESEDGDEVEIVLESSAPRRPLDQN